MLAAYQHACPVTGDKPGSKKAPAFEFPIY